MRPRTLVGHLARTARLAHTVRGDQDRNLDVPERSIYSQPD